MSKRIEIQRETLKRLYLQKNLSTHKIAKIFGCNPTAIQNRLKEYKIKSRLPKKKIAIPKDMLYNLYINQRLSTQKIAEKLGMSSCSVYYKLVEAGIETRQKNIIKISKERLKYLYHNKNLSCSEIGKILKCDHVTIFKKLNNYNIKTKSLSLANTIYPKKRFDGNDELKAYMIGFRLGDLNAKRDLNSSIVKIKSSTTKEEQVKLIKSIYGGYGHFWMKDYNGIYSMECALDKSFNFLVKKEDKIEDWILNKDNLFISFLAGYSDAEGNFGVYSNAARFRVRTYDKNILKQISERLNSMSIKTNFNLESEAGMGNQNQDFYRVSVASKESLLKLILLLKPYLKHEKRFRDMLRCENNILERNKKYEREINL
jgi:predicted DNA-binding protein YlxM (UPF0122 family)